MRAAIKPPGSARVRHEARVLYTLLDAAHSAGIIAGTPTETPWRESDARVRAGTPYEVEAEQFHHLMGGLDASGALAGTWIEERWRSIQHRVATAR